MQAFKVKSGHGLNSGYVKEKSQDQIFNLKQEEFTKKEFLASNNRARQKGMITS